MAQSLQKSLNQGHSFSLGHFFGPVSHNTTPAFGDVRGFPVGRGYWVKMRTRTCSSPQGWKHPWNNRTLRTVYEKSWQNNAKASVLVPDFNKIYLSWIQYEKQIGQPWNPVVISTREIDAQKTVKVLQRVIKKYSRNVRLIPIIINKVFFAGNKNLMYNTFCKYSNIC